MPTRLNMCNTNISTPNYPTKKEGQNEPTFFGHILKMGIFVTEVKP